VLHPRVADRIASNLSEVKRKKGDKEAQMWWGSRFPGMIRADYDEVVRALQRRAGKPA
jgi:hypothetical protein